MASGGVSAYAAISARVRAMYSSLLSPHDLIRLSDVPDMLNIVDQLKHTAYGSYLDNLKDRDLMPARVVLHLKGKLADAYHTTIYMAPEHTRPLLTQLYRYFEVENLKAVLRGITTNSSWDHVRDVLFPIGSITVLPLQAMVETGSVTAAVDLLNNTPYADTLSFAMKRYATEQNLFPLEVALDLYYWRKLWKEAKQLQGSDRDHALRIVGSLLDMNNLMWAIRYRVYYQLSEEELINYTLPFGYRLRDEDVRAIAAGVDIPSVVERIYPGLSDVAALLNEPRGGLPKLESQLKRYVMKQCMAAFVGNPFHIGVPLAFLILSDLEIQDLTLLIEAKFSHAPDDEFRPFLLKTSFANT
ncbi:MAG TPA: V-type ATPase subunit [Anaerolineales bacterium]